MFAGQLAVELELAGIETAQIAQTYVGLSPGSKELERLVLQAKLIHGGHPILRWNADCVEVMRDENDNIRPVKPNRQSSTKRIDGIPALVMALDGWIRRPKARAKRVAFM
jgi:phage terminase large subunit-like protein